MRDARDAGRDDSRGDPRAAAGEAPRRDYRAAASDRDAYRDAGRDPREREPREEGRGFAEEREFDSMRSTEDRYDEFLRRQERRAPDEPRASAQYGRYADEYARDDRRDDRRDAPYR
jgi:hypothetical protein